MAERDKAHYLARVSREMDEDLGSSTSRRAMRWPPAAASSRAKATSRGSPVR